MEGKIIDEDGEELPTGASHRPKSVTLAKLQEEAGRSDRIAKVHGGSEKWNKEEAKRKAEEAERKRIEAEERARLVAEQKKREEEEKAARLARIAAGKDPYDEDFAWSDSDSEGGKSLHSSDESSDGSGDYETDSDEYETDEDD